MVMQGEAYANGNVRQEVTLAHKWDMVWGRTQILEDERTFYVPGQRSQAGI